MIERGFVKTIMQKIVFLEKRITHIALNSSDIEGAIVSNYLIEKIEEKVKLINLLKKIKAFVEKLKEDNKKLFILYYVHGEPESVILSNFGFSSRTYWRRIKKLKNLMEGVVYA